jgi:hypothetical protein
MAKPVMIIDLSNDSVSGLLLDPTYDKTREIFCSPTRAVTRVPLPFQVELNLERFLNQVVTALKTVLEAVAREADSRPAKVICFLSAPFYASQTRVVRHTAEKPFRVTSTLLNNLIATDLKQFIQQHPQLYNEVLDDAHRVIESKTMQIKLNRYPTHLPEGQIASEVELYHYVSIGSERIIARFREVVQGFVHRAPIEFHSFPFALFSICRDHFGDQRYRLLIDIGAEVTEVLLLAEDILWESISFPAGHNGLIRELAKALNTVPEEALSALRIYRQGNQSQSMNGRMISGLANFQKIWTAYFRQTLEALSEQHLVPREIMAIGDPLVTALFLDWLKQGQYNEILGGNQSFNTTVLTATSLAGQCGYQLGTAVNQSEHLLVGSVFYDKLLKVNRHG